VLTLPGVERAGPATSAPIVARSQRAGPVGVVGEQEGPVSQLGAIRSTVPLPVGIAVAVLCAIGAFFVLRGRAERR
jgi:hypothetical protein